MVTKGLRQTDYGDYAEWNALYEGRINSDLLILGNSRAWVHFSPAIIDSVTQYDSYNLGLDGHNFFLTNTRYEEYLTYNTKPRVIIQEVSFRTLEKRPDLFNYAQFHPYLDQESLVEALKTYRGYSEWDRLVPFHKYVGEWKAIAAGLLEFTGLKQFKAEKYKGYEGQARTWKNRIPAAEMAPRPCPIDSASVADFERFLQDSKAAGVEVVLVTAPICRSYQSVITNMAEVVAIYERMASKYNLTYLNYLDHPLADATELYYNAIHLNRKGAERFSLDLANRLVAEHGLHRYAKK